MKYTLILLLSVFCFACTEQPVNTTANHNNQFDTEFLKFELKGNDCAYSGELIKSNRFGGLIEMESGEKLVFASIENLVAYTIENKETLNDNTVIWLADFHAGERLVKVENARLMKATLLRTPNGLGLMAYTGKERIDDNFKFAYNGEHISWDEVINYVKQEWNLE